jgi:hypothetical protein
MSARAWLHTPGVPAAGHIVARGGYWHPGPIAGCAKCPAPVVVHKTADDGSAWPLCGPTRGFWAEGAWSRVTCPACLALR